MAQIEIFSQYTAEIERERRAVAMVDLAIAAQGDSKAIGKKIKELLA